MTEPNFNKTLKTMCTRYGVKDSTGQLVNLSSHMLRHNGITDRLYEGFRLIDIMSMTNHKSLQMIVNSYVHVNENELRNKSKMVINEAKPEILFRGRIINTDDPIRVAQILKRPYAHKIGKIGLCSDISNCPSEMYACLSCNNFIPNADELEYFEEQAQLWEEKLEKFSSHPFMKENANYNLTLFRNIIEKIKKGLNG